ncbi:MAG: DNA-binding protein [Bacteroidaceae bacterium]|nr:DNA-binding protein [Bacteroidaceae bacterium]
MIDYSIVIRGTKPGTKTEDITETKAYGVAQISEILTINEFAKHIAQHGTLYSRDVIQGVLIKMVDCMRELLLEGKKIQLGELGSFSVALSTKGANTAALFTAENIKKVNVNWDRGKMFQNLRDDAVFNLVPSRKAQEDAVAEAKRQETLQPEENEEP